MQMIFFNKYYNKYYFRWCNVDNCFFCYNEYTDMFEKKNSNTLFEHNSNNYIINLLFNKTLFMKFVYNFFLTKLKILQIYIDKYLIKKFIKFFKFSTKIFILFVKKSNDVLRLCVNYRKFNVVTIKNRYSLFFINENFDKLLNVCLKIKFDCWNTFYRIKIKLKNK